MIVWERAMLKKITLRAEEELIREARVKARREYTTLNVLFGQWLGEYVAGERKAVAYRELMERLSYAQSGKKFTRDEMNA